MSRLKRIFEYRTFLEVFRYLKPHRRRVWAVLLLSQATMLLGLLPPFIAKLFIDEAFLKKEYRAFALLLAAAAAIFALNSFLGFLSTLLGAQVGRRVKLDLHRQLLRAFDRAPFDYFQNDSSARQLFRLSVDLEEVLRTVTGIIPALLSLVPKALFLVGLVVWLDWRLAMMVTMLAVGLYAGQYFFALKQKKLWERWLSVREQTYMHLNEVLSRMYLVRAFGKFRDETHRFLRNLIRGIRLEVDNFRVDSLSAFFTSFFMQALSGIVIIFGGLRVMRGELSLGSLAAFTFYVNQLAFLQNMFAQSLRSIALSLVSWERVRGVLFSEAKEEPGLRRLSGALRGEISFRSVCFGYAAGSPVLDRLDFDVGAGARIALVGPSGMGKSTILKLILKLYPSSAGEIRIDGLAIQDLATRDLTERAGVVLQTPYLWDDTVQNNIMYARPDASPREVREAARCACVDTFAERLPQGFATVVGENACRLSEGQKQRIAIARALIKNPGLLILDEALSSVDAQLERQILENIMGAFARSTIIVISHRLSTIQSLPLVYFLESARAMRVATHAQLLQQNPRYRQYLAANNPA